MHVTCIDISVMFSFCSLMLNDAAAAVAADRVKQLCHKSPSIDCWHRSHFGSHPRLVVTTQHSDVSLLDLRVCLNCIIYSLCLCVTSTGYQLASLTLKALL